MDPRVIELLPRIERLARGVARHTPLDVNDALQEARMALWRVARRYPDLDTPSLFKLASARARGAIADLLRSSFVSSRRHGEQLGWSTTEIVGLVEGARACGLLPSLCIRSEGNDELEFVHVSPGLDPEASLLASERRGAMTNWIRCKLSKLNARNRTVACLFLLGVPQIEIAQVCRISSPRVSQILYCFRTGLSEYERKRQSEPRAAA